MPASEDRDATAQLREQITQRYGALARAALAGDTVTDCGDDTFRAGHCGPGGYPTLDGLPAGAVRASMGCGNPVAVADLHAGEVVLDLGSGGGIDVLLSARRVGATGRVYGVDASADMVCLARDNAAQVGAANVEFLHGGIEHLPLPDRAVDVVISNCVLNLSTDKPRALAEPPGYCAREGASGSATSWPAPTSTPPHARRPRNASGASWARSPSTSTASYCGPPASSTSPSDRPPTPRTACSPRSCVRPNQPHTHPEIGSCIHPAVPTSEGGAPHWAPVTTGARR